MKKSSTPPEGLGHLCETGARVGTFRECPACPVGDYPWHKYYWRRPSPGGQFESGYWGKVVDPDGVERHLFLEREQKISDQKAEIDFINSLPPGRVLDVGCGPGFTLSGIDDRWRKFGNEVSDVASSMARQYGEITVGDLLDVRYSAETFDAITMIHVLRYVDDPARYVQEVRRILKLGGHLVLAEADYDSGCARRFKERYRLLHDKRSINLFTSFSLVRLLEDSGFTILKVDYPFFETSWFTSSNLLRMLDDRGVSPPAYGNFVTLYAAKSCAVED